MRFGVHLPIADLGDGLPAWGTLREYTAAAASLGYATVAANDHVVWRRPWLDGPTALTAVLAEAGDLTLATSVGLPVIRGPAVFAKWLATLAVLSGNRVVAGLGPGSSRADYAAVGIPFDQRWARFDEALALVRSLVRGEPPAPGTHDDIGQVRLDPLPSPSPEVWFGSWGSDQRLRASARLADGWMASAYNTTPRRFAAARERLDGHLRSCGRDPGGFPDMVVTMWLYVTDDREYRDHLLQDVLAPILGRDPRELGEQLPIGTPRHCVDLLTTYAAVGASEVLLWPIRDPVPQLEVFSELMPAVGGATAPPGRRHGGGPSGG